MFSEEKQRRQLLGMEIKIFGGKEFIVVTVTNILPKAIKKS